MHELEQCKGEDKEFCDCCSFAVALRDFENVLRDPQTCTDFGEVAFSGECPDIFLLCCTGQGILCNIISLARVVRFVHILKIEQLRYGVVSCAMCKMQM